MWEELYTAKITNYTHTDIQTDMHSNIEVGSTSD